MPEIEGSMEPSSSVEPINVEEDVLTDVELALFKRMKEVTRGALRHLKHRHKMDCSEEDRKNFAQFEAAGFFTGYDAIGAKRRWLRSIIEIIDTLLGGDSIDIEDFNKLHKTLVQIRP